MLESVQRRVLWLATSIVHHANKVRKTPSGVKVGWPSGVVGVDGVDHDGAVFRAHARARTGCRSSRTRRRCCTRSTICSDGSIEQYLTELRAFGGSAVLPVARQGSRSGRFLDGVGRDRRDRDAVVARSRTATSPVTSTSRRGAGRSRWSATPSSTRARSGRRSSIRWCRASARCCGSSTSTASRLTASCRTSRRAGSGRCSRRPGGGRSRSSTAVACARLFARPGGEALRRRIDAMANEEYQRLLRVRRGGAARAAAGLGPRVPRELSGCSRTRGRRGDGGDPRSRRSRPCRSARSVPAGRRRARSSGGDLRLHDQGVAAADAGPSGKPLGAAVGRAVGAAGGRAAAPMRPRPWERFRGRVSRRRSCATRGRRSRCRRGSCAARATGGPGEIASRRTGGRLDAAGVRSLPRRARPRGPGGRRARRDRLPDVASSTNLGGWINRAGVWNPGERIDWFADDTDTLVRWRESEHGQHIELGIAEGNLVGLLGELGCDVVARRAAAAADRHPL